MTNTSSSKDKDLSRLNYVDLTFEKLKVNRKMVLDYGVHSQANEQLNYFERFFCHKSDVIFVKITY